MTRRTTPQQALLPERHNNLLFLDGLRGIAALIVMVGHARWLLWEGYSDGFLQHPDQYSKAAKVFVYFLSMFRYGHQSVLFFFVLSGFVIHLKYAKALKADSNAPFNLGSYFVRRIKRIYPPYLFVLLITWLLDVGGSRLGFSIYSQQTPNSLINANVSTDHSIINLFGNLLFWRNDKVGTWGTNGPLWSLKYEWWFYLVYPLIFLASRKRAWLPIIIVVFCFALSFYLPAGGLSFAWSVLQYLLCWWLGGFLADINSGRTTIGHLVPAVFSLVLPFMIVIESKIHNVLVADIGWALGFFGLLNLLLYLKSRGWRFIGLNKLRWLGDCSYTLYIVHFPVLVFINGLILHFNDNKMPVSLIFVVLGTTFCIALAWALHFVLEKPFIGGRKPTVQPA